MRFVDLNTGAIYNGDAPYIHWFDDEQSTNLNYVKKLCVICDDEYININLSNNNIFTLLNMSVISNVYDENINGFSYKDIEHVKTNNINSKGYLYDIESQHMYLHMIYILASCKQEGEYLEDLYINGEKFIIGSSFYDKYEPHKINLSNLGVEIPESVARAIYDSNVHEDEIDNILLNRKYKELLNEYWNIIANKGSYKSLYNALSWFEYGDLIKIQEFWQNTDSYNQQDIKSYISTRVSDYLSNNKKTTYIGLYLPLQQLCKDKNENIKYPSIAEVVNLSNYNGFIREENPELMDVCTKWSHDDLCLKMYLVGNFFETYFMPIHLDLIHSTVENIVFTNTIKILHEHRINRTDYVNNFFTFKCNVNDGDVFFLENVSTQTGSNTTAGIQWDDSITTYDDMHILGVEENVSVINNENDIKTFMAQRYNGVGCIVKFKCDVSIDKDDFISQLNIILTNDRNTVSKKFKLLSSQLQSKDIEFNILCKNEGDYVINLEFITANQYNYVKVIKFSVLDNTSKNIKIYKVKYNTKAEHRDRSKYLGVQNYMNSQYRAQYSNQNNGKYTTFFIPEYMQSININDISKIDGIFMHRTIITYGDISAEQVIPDFNIRKNTEVLKKYKYPTDEVSYTIFILPVDTPVDFEPPVDKSILVRNDFVFYPEKHHLEEIASGNNITLDDYTFSQKDVLMVVPNSKYLKYIEDPEWEFENISRKNRTRPITLKSIQTPFIANVNYKLLDPGFYNVKFRYKLGQSIQEVSLDSAFRIV
jgi:hypothetical protein